MLHFWFILFLTMLAAYFQHKFGDLGKSIETFCIAAAYTVITYLMRDYSLTYTMMHYVAVPLWCFWIVTLFKPRYKELKD